MSLFRAFRHRSFLLVWSGQTASRLGDGVHRVALAWLVLELTGSAAAMGAVLTAELLPMLLLLVVGGVAVDRLPRAGVMLASDGIRAALVAVVPVLVISGGLGLPPLLVLSIAFGIVAAFFQPAYGALIPELVPAEDRASANALSLLSGRLADLIGPLAGAVLVAAGGTAVAFAVDAATYAVAAIAILPVAIRGRRPRPAPAEAPIRSSRLASAVADLGEGFRAVVVRPWIALTITIAGVTNITLAGPLESVLPALVARELGGDVGVLGLLGAVMAAGSVVAAVILGRQRVLRHRGPLIFGAWVVLALATAVMGVPIGIAGVAVAAAVVGFMETTLGLAWLHALQEHVPAELLGRVSALDALGSYALIPVGYLVAGVAADAVGPAPVFVAGGLISAVLLGVTALHPAIRGLD